MQVDYRAVLGFISDHAGGYIDVERQQGQLIRLIHKAALDVMGIGWLENAVEEVAVIDGIAKTPCYCVRILRVMDQNDAYKVPFERMNASEYLKVNERFGTIRVYFRRLPMTEVDGKPVPALDDRMIDYCGWYAVNVLIEEMFVQGKTTPAVVSMIDEKCRGAYERAKGQASRVSIDEMEGALRMMRLGQFIGGN